MQKIQDPNADLLDAPVVVRPYTQIPLGMAEMPNNIAAKIAGVEITELHSDNCIATTICNTIVTRNAVPTQNQGFLKNCLSEKGIFYTFVTIVI